jgi:tRNA-splicing ligase RtcB
MISKEKFKKISDWLWELPKSFRQDMRVPVRVYASEKMLNDIFRDRSVEQLVNVSTLPGIQKYALAMPDMHEGYAAPVGGVAALDAKEGVIAPGMQGYDINCLAPDAEVKLPFGAFLKIKDLRKYWLDSQVVLIDKQAKRLKSAKVVNFLARKEDSFLYSIKTKSGYCLKATSEHPLYTPAGMKKAEDLKAGEKIVIYPFKGTAYEKPKKKALIDEKKVIRALKELNLPDNGNRWLQIIKWFKEKRFLGLCLSSPQLPYLIKIIGYSFGDGTLNLMTKKRRGVACFYGKLEDLKDIQLDLKTIGVHSKIYTRKRRHEFKIAYQKTYKLETTENCLRVGSTAFVVLLHILGAPLGSKTYQKIHIPSWLWEASLWQKRLFLAAFFGAELSKPKLLGKFNFSAPTLNLNKATGLEKEGYAFLEEIKKLLREFKVSSSETVRVAGLAYKEKTVGLRLRIKASLEELIRFYETIGFEYNKEKQRLACLAVAYLRRKKRVIERRENVRNLVRVLYKKGVLARELTLTYSSKYADEGFIKHSIWSERVLPRIAFNFPSFAEYVKKYSCGKDGFVIDEIEEIRKESYRGLVYDLTIGDNDHNFIANNIVVSNCGVRLLKSGYKAEEIKPYIEQLATEIQKEVPSGLGRGRQLKLSVGQIDKVLKGGVPKLVEQGYGEKEDVENCEGGGKLEPADASSVSRRAKERGRDQLGTLGSGNHFLEIQRVEEVFDEETAKAFGLFKGQVVLMVHCGSRGLGHQVCTDYLREFIPLMENKYKIKVPDKEFACVPFDSPEGKRALSASYCAANFAWGNRQMITYFVRKAWQRVLGREAKLTLLYDVAHNIIKKEKYFIGNKELEVAVHRKGATRAFPPQHPEIPQNYREVGQPVLIPGSMGTASYVLVGTKEGEESFYSTCHGAGRTMSRRAAIRQFPGKEVVKNLAQKGILVKCFSYRGIAEEAPLAYKNIDEVIEVVHNARLSKKVAKLVPLAVIKGE